MNQPSLQATTPATPTLNQPEDQGGAAAIQPTNGLNVPTSVQVLDFGNWQLSHEPANSEVFSAVSYPRFPWIRPSAATRNGSTGSVGSAASGEGSDWSIGSPQSERSSLDTSFASSSLGNLSQDMSSGWSYASNYLQPPTGQGLNHIPASGLPPYTYMPPPHSVQDMRYPVPGVSVPALVQTEPCYTQNAPACMFPAPNVEQPAAHSQYGDFQLTRDSRDDLMPLPMMQSSSFQMPISVRVGLLMMRFMSMESLHKSRIFQLQDFYKMHSAELEAERYRRLSEACQTPWNCDSINVYFDQQHHQLIDQIGQSLDYLETLTLKKSSKLAPVAPKPPPAAPPSARNKENVSADSLWSKSKGSHLNCVAVKIMTNWYERNREHPYPSYDTAEVMAKAGNISVEQAKKWFANRRMRSHNTKPLKEIARRRKRVSSGTSEVFLMESKRFHE